MENEFGFPFQFQHTDRCLVLTCCEYDLSVFGVSLQVFSSQCALLLAFRARGVRSIVNDVGAFEWFVDHHGQTHLPPDRSIKHFGLSLGKCWWGGMRIGLCFVDK